MKLLGPKSASSLMSKIFLALFIILLLHSVYQLFGFGIGYYNWTTSNNFLAETFYVNDEIDYASYKKGEYLFYKFKYPFSDKQMLTGFFTANTFINHTFQNIFFCLFLWYGYKLFKDFTARNIFTETTIRHLQTFSVINTLYAPLYFFIWIFIFRSGPEINMLMMCSAFLFLGIILHFVMAFFKKGFYLQSESDLTI